MVRGDGMKVCQYGLGRIGLPIALVLADSGCRVTGIDINRDLVRKLQRGQVPFIEPGLEELLKKHINDRFIPKHPNDGAVIEDIASAEYIVIAVGTSFARYPEKPDLSKLYSIIGELITAGIRDKTIILRVTLPIGTKERVIDIIEKKTGLKEGKDFWFAFVPERIMEGKAIEEERTLPKIVGCKSEETFSKVKKLFDKVGGKIIRVSNPRTAEFIKLIDNAWRNTRFAFANELALLAEKHDIDVMEAINKANEGYKRNDIPIPGPVSGYCLGKDPYILELAFREIAEKRGFNSVWYYGRLANDWLVEKLVNEVQGENVLILGLSFKADVDDFRYSHSIGIIRKLLEKGYKVYVHDPFFGINNYTSLDPEIRREVKPIRSLLEIPKEIDTIIISTPHKEYREIDPSIIPKHVLIVDLWNIWRWCKGRNPYRSLGLV